MGARIPATNKWSLRQAAGDGEVVQSAVRAQMKEVRAGMSFVRARTS